MKTLKFSVILFHSILEIHNIKHIDFLSIDVEGAELDILYTLDFKKVNVSVITV